MVAIEQRLQVGWHTNSLNGENKQAIWAHVHSVSTVVSKASGRANIVSYHTEDSQAITDHSFRSVELLEPFKHIKDLRGDWSRRKTRLLVLMFFLRLGHLSQVNFGTEGLDELRRAVALIAKARSDAGHLPTQSTYVPTINNSPTVNTEEFLSSASVADIPAVAIAQKEAGIMTAAIEHAPGYGKRERDRIEQGEETERSAKKSNADPGYYHYQKLMEHMNSQKNEELQPMKDEIAKLQAQNTQRVKERDEWRSKSLNAHEQLRTSQKELVMAGKELVSARAQLKDMSTNYQKRLGELESTKKLLNGEIEARKDSERKRRTALKDLQQSRMDLDRSRAFGKELLELAAKLSDDGSA